MFLLVLILLGFMRGFMIIEPTLFDHVSLVASRLHDEGIDFPSRKDLVSVSEFSKPELFNFFSVHGKVVFIQKRAGRFCLFCRNFNPANFGLSSVSYNRHKGEFVLRYYDDFSLAVRDFSLMVQGLCKVALDEAARSFSNG